RDSRVPGGSATTRRIQDVMATDEMETDMARRDSEEDKQHGADGAQADTDPSVSTTENESGRTPRLGLRAPAKMATEEVAAPVVGFVRDTLSGAIHATGSVASEAVEVVRDVLTGTLHATEEVATE